ncbi:hypothetical protein DSUL_80053 [Desulfovibrionales bacterium]
MITSAKLYPISIYASVTIKLTTYINPSILPHTTKSDMLLESLAGRIPVRTAI